MCYEDICQKLGFIADSRFIKVTSSGSISFTCGKTREVMRLYAACRDHGFVPSKALTAAAKER